MLVRSVKQTPKPKAPKPKAPKPKVSKTNAQKAKAPSTARAQRSATPKTCPKCASRQVIKSGFVQNQQRWKCKACAYQFTRIAPKGRPLWQKSLVVFLYSYGLSLHQIARIFHVQPSTVLKWVRLYAQDHVPTPEAGVAHMVELTALRHHLKSSKSGRESTLCIVIDDATFTQNKGILISKAR